MASLLCGPTVSRGTASSPSCSYTPGSSVHFTANVLPRALVPPAQANRTACLALSGLRLDLPTPSLRPRGDRHEFDIFGLGQAMVDFSGMVDDDALQRMGLVKGGRRVITVAERAALIEELTASGFTLNAGGSLANTLSGCAVLGRAAHARAPFSPRGSHALRVGLGGCIGEDHLGSYFRSQISTAGVQWISPAAPGTCTGTVIVLTTPDAQRSFMSYPGTSDELVVGGVTEAAIRSSRILVIEGYLWEFPNAGASITRAIEIAREAGTLVALTMADASVVVRHRAAMMQAVQAADILFTNSAEAVALLGEGGARCTTHEAALQLGCLCPVAIVTDGSKGSFITALGELHVIPPHWTAHGPVDTCGAGDAYAAGVLYGYLSGFDVWQMGEFAAETAARVISQQGPELTQAHADELVAAHPCRRRLPTSWVGVSGLSAGVVALGDRDVCVSSDLIV